MKRWFKRTAFTWNRNLS